MATRKALLRWCAWFFGGNIALFWLIGLNYLSVIPWVHSLYLASFLNHELNFFITISYLGQLGLLAFLPFFLVSPCIIWVSSRRFVMLFSMVLATFAAFLLLTDTIIYHLYRFHLNGIIFQFIIHGLGKHFFGIANREWLELGLAFLIIMVIETILAYCVWHFLIIKNRARGLGKWAVIFMGFNLYLSYCMIAYSFGYTINRIMVEASEALPLYTETISLGLPKFLSVHMLRQGQNYEVHDQHGDWKLNYPLKVLQFDQAQKKPNLVIILIDAWRFDMLNPSVTPFLSDFAKQSWHFTQHLSGGNATGPGVFSIFYGIPATYWNAMEAKNRGPVLIDELLKQNYKVGIFSSPTLAVPAFHKTVFAALKNTIEDPVKTSLGEAIKIEGNPYERDVKAVNAFIHFLDQPTKQPIFSYIHLDSVHSYCDLDNLTGPFVPFVKRCDRASLTTESDPAPYLNRYKNALYLDDQLVHKIIAGLANRKLLQNTVVIITGDHGEEFNDTHHGYWSHASNYTKYQTATPLIVYWPGAKPKVFTHTTSHFDLVPTLMKRLFHCRNSFSDYSVGTDLLDNKNRPYQLIGGYMDFGIVEKDRITRVFSAGQYQVQDVNGLFMPDVPLDMPVIQQSFALMHKFYK